MSVECRKCGCDAFDAGDRGAYLKRACPVGTLPAIWECSPSCEHKHGGPKEALLGALEDNELTEVK